MESSISFRISNKHGINPCPRTPQPASPWTTLTRFAIIKYKKRISFWGYYRTQRKYSFAVYPNNEPGDPVSSTPLPLPLPPPPSFDAKRWFLGFLVLLILPFSTSKWGPIRESKDRFDNILQRVENVAEEVEAVANEVDKMTEDIGRDLAKGKLKDLVESVERGAEITAKAADCLDNVIDKVQEVEEQVERIVEAVVKRAKGRPPNQETN